MFWLDGLARLECMTTSPEPQAIAERQLCGLVNGLAQQITDHLRERAATLGLTAAQATALREMTGPMTMRELAERMSCEPSNATFVVDKLEKQGLIERRPHPTDRRAKQLVLTAEGNTLRERLLELLARDSPLAGLTSEQQRSLQDLLEQAITRP
jgi:DNA-binding MarR family transcriptional regulator